MENEQRIERTRRELWADLMNLVENGDLTDLEAMEWYNAKCDQWANGLG